MQPYHLLIVNVAAGIFICNCDCLMEDYSAYDISLDLLLIVIGEILVNQVSHALRTGFHIFFLNKYEVAEVILANIVNTKLESKITLEVVLFCVYVMALVQMECSFNKFIVFLIGIHFDWHNRGVEAITISCH